MTGYEYTNHSEAKDQTEPATTRYPNREWERKALEDLIASVKAHPDLAEKLHLALKLARS